MSLNPLNELKRRLDNDKTPLPKRLCLAKNVVQSHHFPTAPKERIVAEWLHALAEKNKLSSEELKNVLNWLSGVDDLTSELKSELIQIVSQYTQRNPIKIEDIQYILTFLENPKISSQLSLEIDHYLCTIITVLQFLRNNENGTLFSQRILNNLIKYYKESKKKLEFIIKLLSGETLETIFAFLDTECRSTAIDVCQNILFPINKKTFFISFLQTLIRKDNIKELIAEKGDNIQSVIKIMNAFFEFPANRSNNNPKFLENFIDVFVSCFKKENQIIFAFYIMITSVLNMEQDFIVPAMNLPKILAENDAKVKRNLFLNMLETLLKNEVDINVRLTDTFGEKIPKLEIKKNFIYFLQVVMMGQLKLEGKLDKTTLQIIKTALKLDPGLIEQKLDLILPPIMTAKKNSSSIESYTETINCLLEILFKLSRGTLFINQILPSIKNILEACNTDQFELKQKVHVAKESGLDYEKIEGKIITGSDLLPPECVLLYGKLTSELMFRQNKELLESLQKDLEVHCLMMLEEGFVSPSIIVLTELLSAILSSFLQYNKMADHTVPLNIAEDFWNMYNKFEEECLSKFGNCVLKLSYNPPLIISFLKLCQSFAQLKLLNIKYSNVKLDISLVSDTSDVLDLSMILPCLNSEQWKALAAKIEDGEAVVILDNLLLTKTMALHLLSIRNKQDYPMVASTKTHLIKQITANPSLLQSNYFCKILFQDLNKSHIKILSKYLVKLCLSDPDLEILKMNAISNNKDLLNALVLETAKSIVKCFENENSLSNILKGDFSMSSFAKAVDINSYFKEITIKPESQEILKISVNIFKQLPLHYLEENYQLVAIFVMLAIKKCSSSKKLRRNIDYVLQSIYELSSQRPDLYQIFSADSIFNFKDNTLLELFTLRIKTSNNLLIVKSLLEIAVKKVRIDCEQLKNIVGKLLMKNNKDVSNIESFNDPVFQITCLILPSIVKQKKAITASVFRSILADLQEKLHNSLLESFYKLDYSHSSFSQNVAGNTDDSLVENGSSMATLNAMVAYSLTLSRYCEATDGEDNKNLRRLLAPLEFFVQNAITTIEHSDSKPQHIEASAQLLTVVLRHAKKLEPQSKIFEEKDKLFLQIWRSIKTRLLLEEDSKRMHNSCLEEMGITLRFICELCSVDCYVTNFVGDLNNLVVLKKPSVIQKDNKSDIKSRKVFKYLWSQCLKANIVGPKCVAMSKLMCRACKNLRNWMRQHYEFETSVARIKEEITAEDEVVKIIKVEDDICEIVRLDLDSLSEILLAAKKVSLDYNFVDITFEVQHLIHYVLGSKSQVKCDISWEGFFMLYEGCVAVLNNLLLAREEVLEDRWPCYMQCYRALITSLCERSSTQTQIDKSVEEKLAEIAHSIEKLTQSISKRKKHLTRIAAYTVADICTSLEQNAPTKMVRQHLENSVALLIQACDSTYAMAFLKRGLVGLWSVFCDLQEEWEEIASLFSHLSPPPLSSTLLTYMRQYLLSRHWLQISFIHNNDVI